jgi:hypothetical protein
VLPEVTARKPWQAGRVCRTQLYLITPACEAECAPPPRATESHIETSRAVQDGMSNLLISTCQAVESKLFVWNVRKWRNSEYEFVDGL